MNKGEWYKFLFSRADEAIEKEYFFEATFICYGIIEDRLNALIETHPVSFDGQGVAKKVKALAKKRSKASENLLEFDGWDGGKYRYLGKLHELLSWGEVYRNPIQHQLGDPKKYKASIGDFHNEHSRDLAVEGVRIARELSSTLMRFKRHRSKFIN